MKLSKIIIKLLLAVFILLLLYYSFVAYMVLKTERTEIERFKEYKLDMVNLQEHIYENYDNIFISYDGKLGSGINEVTDGMIIDFFSEYDGRYLSYNSKKGYLSIETNCEGCQGHSYLYTKNYNNICKWYNKNPSLLGLVVDYIGKVCLGDGWVVYRSS